LEQHAHGQATYYTPTEKLKNPETYDSSGLHAIEKTVPEFSLADSSYLSQVPTEIRDSVESLGKRNAPAEVQKVIEDLCDFRPFTLNELALIINRTKKYSYENYIKPMIIAGKLELTIPSIPNSPHQAYKKRKI
jgi:ATP-dependent DNA helicase RecG